VHCNALKGVFRVLFENQKQFFATTYACLRSSARIVIGTKGEVYLTNGWLRTGELDFRGTGKLTTSNDGALFVDRLEWSGSNSKSLDLGPCAVNIGYRGGSALVTVGTGEELIIGGPLEVGYTGTGNAEMRVVGGGSVEHSYDGTGHIGVRYLSDGSVTVTGAGSRWHSVDSLEVGAGGHLEVEGGSEVQIDNTLTNNGTVSVSDGELVVRDAQMRRPGSKPEGPDDVFSFTGGTLTVAVFGGTLVCKGGTITPGWGGEMSIVGGLQINSGTTRIRIRGQERFQDYDVISVNGVVRWGGTLEVVLTDGFVPGVGYEFDIFDFDPEKDEQWFSELSLPDLPGGLRWDVSELYVTGKIRIASGNVILAWGRSIEGQLLTPAIGGFGAIAASGSFADAVGEGGLLLQWGFSPYGSTPPIGGGFVGVDAGGFHAVALHGDGHLEAWGSNMYGESDVPEGNDFKEIAAGFNHCLALRNNGSLAGWGADSHGQSLVPSGTGYKAIAAGYNFRLALRNDDSIEAWGSNLTGVIDDVPAGNDFVAIDGGKYHAIALRSNGSIVVWGSDTYGELNVPPSHDISVIACGDNFSLAVADDRPMPDLTDPFSGSVVTAGMPYEVKWTNWQKIDDMLVYYSVSGPSAYSSIVPQNHGNISSYQWEVPQVVSPNCYMEIRDARDPGLRESEGPFEIRMPIFVDKSASGWNDGTSWQDAYTSLQDALAAANEWDSVWVAASAEAYCPDAGAGLFNTREANPRVSDCTFLWNRAGNAGGGAANYHGSDSIFEDCSFQINRAQYGGGRPVQL